MADGGTVPDAPKTGFDRFAEKLNNGKPVAVFVEIELESPDSTSASEIAPPDQPIFDRFVPFPSATARKRNVPLIFGKQFLRVCYNLRILFRCAGLNEELNGFALVTRSIIEAKTKAKRLKDSPSESRSKLKVYYALKNLKR